MKIGKLIHQPCNHCSSSDAMTINEDGSTKCYSCGEFTPVKTRVKKDQPEDVFLLTDSIDKYSKLPYGELIDRGISKSIGELYKVKVEYYESNGEVAKHFYPYTKGGSTVGYKIRNVDGKIFYTVGDVKGVELFGTNTINGGRKLIILFEGECDAMAGKEMLKAQGKDYNCVSLSSGTSLGGLRENMEFLDEFETVMLDFDQDKPGKEALDKAVGFFKPGKVKVVTHTGYKDANEMLKDGQSKQFLKDVYNAKVHRPDGIVQMGDDFESLFEDEVDSVPYPWSGLNDKLYGLRGREIVTFTGGSGIGKSAIVRELEHWLLNNTEDNIGVLALEESTKRTKWGIMAIEANKPLAIREERKGISKEDIKVWFDKTLGTGRYYSFNHFGSTDEDNLLSKVGYMVRVLGCKWVILDHLSIVVSAMDQGLDERRTIDSVMTKLRQLTEETGTGLLLVSHLKRTSDSRGHENGLEVSLNHLRGSQSIAQLSDAVVAAERNQQADDDTEANTLTIRVLKNRYAGLTGPACKLVYDRDTGRLIEEAFITEATKDDEF